MRTILATISVIAVMLLLALLYVFPLKETRDLSSFDVDYPHTISERVTLKADGDGSKEVYRLSTHDDHGIKVLDTIDYENGVQSKVSYRLDGTVDKVVDYFPEEVDGTRKVKNRIQMMEDGIRYAWHKAFRLDGSIERSGQRLPNGSYTTVYYRADKAGTIERQVAFSEEQDLEYEIVYAESGMPRTKTERKGRELATTHYRENGMRAYTLVKSDAQSMSGIFYSEDGMTEVGDFQKYSYGTTVSVIPEDTSKLSKIQARYSDESRDFTAFGANGKARFMQKWKLIDGKSYCDDEGTWTLVEITEFHGEDFSGLYNWSDNMEVEMHEDGTTPKKIVVEKGNNTTIEVHLHPDGSVERLIEFDDKGKRTGSTTYEPGEKENPVPIRDELLAFNKVGCLPIDLIGSDLTSD